MTESFCNVPEAVLSWHLESLDCSYMERAAVRVPSSSRQHDLYYCSLLLLLTPQWLLHYDDHPTFQLSRPLP